MQKGANLFHLRLLGRGGLCFRIGRSGGYSGNAGYPSDNGFSSVHSLMSF
jgi:hypothetical protein